MLRLAVIALAGCWTSSAPTPAPPPPPQPTYSSPRAAAPAPAFPQTTPREAIESFLDAIDARRYDIVMRFIPAKYTSTLTEDKIREEFEGPSSASNRALIDEIRARVGTANIVEKNETASMDYGPSKNVELVREDGVWKIQDLD